jgi:ADP-heptose:LPS heptosyltransferase
MDFLKNILRHFWYSTRDLYLPKVVSTKKDKSLVILRVDAIGDYILFRNFLEIIKRSEKYKDYSITLIGNEIWKPISEKLDSKWVDRFIWVNLKAFHKSFQIRKATLKEIEDTTYDVLFHPTYSGDYYVSEIIAKRINATIKIASIGELSNTTYWQKRLSNKIYNKLIPIEKEIFFEFEKNKATTHHFIEEEPLITKPFIDINKINEGNHQLHNYIIFFIGGSLEFKKWNTKKWISLADKMLKHYSYNLVLSGSSADYNDGEIIKLAFKNNDRVINACGKTSLYGLVELISNASFMVSNETSAPHIAVALNVPVVVIANGSQLGRFTPYPEHFGVKYSVVFPPQLIINKNLANLVELYSNESPLLVNDIKTEKVYSAIRELFPPA